MLTVSVSTYVEDVMATRQTVLTAVPVSVMMEVMSGTVVCIQQTTSMLHLAFSVVLFAGLIINSVQYAF